MSFIDVTDVILDPMVAGQTAQVVRRQQEVDDRGEGVVSLELIPEIICGIWPSGDNTLVRTEDYSTLGQEFTIVTIFRLRGQTREVSTGRSFLPDLVLHDGNAYIVNKVNEYTHYGPGFLECTCESIDYQQNPDNALPANVGQLDFTDPAQAIYAALLANPPKED